MGYLVYLPNLFLTSFNMSYLYSAGEDRAVQQGHFGLHCPEVQCVSSWRTDNGAVGRQMTGHVSTQ